MWFQFLRSSSYFLLKDSLTKFDSTGALMHLNSLLHTNGHHEFLKDYFAALLISDKESIDFLYSIHKCGICVTATDENGDYPLMIATQNNNIEAIEILILGNHKIFVNHDSVDDIGVLDMVNMTNKHGETALMIACRLGYSTAALVLVQKGANARLQNLKGDTALILSILSGCYKTLDLIISSSANLDVNARNKEGQTALMIAAARDDLHQVKMLVNNLNAAIHLKDLGGKTALDYTSSQDIKYFLLNKVVSYCEPFLEKVTIKPNYLKPIGTTENKEDRIKLG